MIAVRQRSDLHRFLLIGAMLCVHAPVFAAKAPAHDVDTTGWQCEFCPFLQGHDGEYFVGVSNVSDESAYVGDATGYDDDGLYANLDGTGSYSKDGNSLSWYFRDVGVDARTAAIEGRHGGTFDWRLAWDELPRRRYFTSESIFSSANGTLQLPAGWVRAPTTSGFTNLADSLARTDIESDRSRLELGGRYRLAGAFSLSANLSRRERSGTDMKGAPYFTQSTLVPQPVDQVTDEVDVSLDYRGERGFLSLAWYLSEFDNQLDALRWQTPFTSAPGAEVAALAEAPDNRFNEVRLSGAARFAPGQTVASFSTAIGRLTQDDALLAYTTNTSLGAASLPRPTLDGEVDTFRATVALTSRFAGRGRAKLSWTYDERDNGTAVDDWMPVIADTFLSGEVVRNVPYSFERSNLRLSAEYPLFNDLRIGGGYDRRTTERTFQEVADQTEDRGWGRVQWLAAHWLDIELRAGASERDVDAYDDTLAADLGQNPLLRKYNMAYRYRRFGELSASISPSQLPVSLTLTGLYADDKYNESPLGISSGRESNITADLAWTVNDRTSLYVNGGFEKMDTSQSGSQAFATADWRATSNDEFTNFGAGFRMRNIAEKFDFFLDYVMSDGATEIVVDPLGASAGRFPDLEAKLDYFRAGLTYRRSERLAFRLRVLYERLDTDDWTIAGVAPATIPVVLTMGALPYDDEALVVTAGFTWSPVGDR